MHIVRGLVAKLEPLTAFAHRHALHSPVPVVHGLAILPPTFEDIETRLAPSRTGCPDDFEHFYDELAKKCSAASVEGPLLYSETEYHGGCGGHGAVVFDAGAPIFGPKSGEIGPINEALRILGVHVSVGSRPIFFATCLSEH